MNKYAREIVEKMPELLQELRDINLGKAQDESDEGMRQYFQGRADAFSLAERYVIHRVQMVLFLESLVMK